MALEVRERISPLLIGAAALTLLYVGFITGLLIGVMAGYIGRGMTEGRTTQEATAGASEETQWEALGIDKETWRRFWMFAAIAKDPERYANYLALRFKKNDRERQKIARALRSEHVLRVVDALAFALEHNVPQDRSTGERIAMAVGLAFMRMQPLCKRLIERECTEDFEIGPAIMPTARPGWEVDASLPGRFTFTARV